MVIIRPNELFDWILLQINFWKTVGMVCQTCHIVVWNSGADYIKRLIGEGP